MEGSLCVRVSIICAAVAYAEIRALTDFLLAECCADAPDGEQDHG